MENKNPILMYKMCYNKDYNDFNGEPKYVEIPYQVWETKDDKAFVSRSGWFSKKHRHWIEAKSLYIKT